VLKLIPQIRNNKTPKKDHVLLFGQLMMRRSTAVCRPEI
jgi:hypothetical protein